MKYKVEKKEGKVEIKFTLTAEEWEQNIESAYAKTKHKYAKEGFRKGHVPRAVIEATYGKSVFFEDAFNEAFPKYYGEVLDKNEDIYPVDRPEIDIQSVDDSGIKFSAIVVVKPEVTLGKYKGLKIKKVPATVSDEDVENELKKAQERSARIIDVEGRKVENGDEVVLDYSGSVDGVKFEGGTAEKQNLTIGSKAFIPGFEEQLIGMDKGQSKDITVKFPEDYHAEELKGKDAVFAVTIHEIKAKELPLIDDEFAKDVSEFNTLAEYKEDIRKNLTSEKEKDAKIKEENALLEEIVKGCSVEIPQAMIETQIDSYLDEFNYTLMYQGLKMEDYLKYTGNTTETLRNMYKDKAKVGVETRLVMEAIIKAEDMKADAKSVDAKLTEYAANSKQTLEEFKATLSKDNLDYVKNQVLTDKLLTFLRAENTIA